MTGAERRRARRSLTRPGQGAPCSPYGIACRAESPKSHGEISLGWLGSSRRRGGCHDACDGEGEVVMAEAESAVEWLGGPVVGVVGVVGRPSRRQACDPCGCW